MCPARHIYCLSKSCIVKAHDHQYPCSHSATNSVEPTSADGAEPELSLLDEEFVDGLDGDDRIHYTSALLRWEKHSRALADSRRELAALCEALRDHYAETEYEDES